MKSPIKIRKHLVTRAPARLKPTQYDSNLYTIKEITQEDIDKDSWLNKRKKVFVQFLKNGQIGHIILNENNECIAYGWIAMGAVKPSHIPRIPAGSAWFHYERVRDDYQGRGVHRLLIQERVRLMRRKYGDIKIFTDTSEDNIASRINQERVGFVEYGIYYTVKIGTRRIPFLYALFGKWDKNKKHPEIIKNGNI